MPSRAHRSVAADALVAVRFNETFGNLVRGEAQHTTYHDQTLRSGACCIALGLAALPNVNVSQLNDGPCKTYLVPERGLAMLVDPDLEEVRTHIPSEPFSYLRFTAAQAMRCARASSLRP